MQTVKLRPRIALHIQESKAKFKHHAIFDNNGLQVLLRLLLSPGTAPLTRFRAAATPFSRGEMQPRLQSNTTKKRGDICISL
jgi:hypothetical protein